MWWKRRQEIITSLCKFFQHLVVQILICMHHFLLSRCEHGILSSSYPGNVLMPFQGCLSFQLATDTSNLTVLSLREAARTGSRCATATKCNCRTNCATKRCPCRSAGNDCSSHCHPKHPGCTNRADLIENRNIECGISENSNIECDITEIDDKPLSLFEWRKRKLESRPARSSKRKQTYCSIELSEEELGVIRNGEWLTDRHILAALTLLKRQFPNMGGLHDTLFGVDLSFPKTTHPLSRY